MSLIQNSSSTFVLTFADQERSTDGLDVNERHSPLVSSASVEYPERCYLPYVPRDNSRQLSGTRRGCREHLGRTPYLR